ncbi:MAG: coenzyme F420-0:L-glutamate ligase [Acidaminococcales bacterium]|jgi:F420-0:gamma-glutamyl ligase|nr:coenzyme F420-0:L-glutamate ligase [Acidaminococcales bacterium]
MKVVPVKTRILTERDDIVKAVAEYTRGQVEADDVIAVAESVLAITQGRAKRPEDMRPCFLAKILCRFFPQKGSLSARHSMQALMEEEGRLRVLCAFVAGFLAKLAGRPGVFYQLAGEQARLIDDVTGTMPPFDKHIVYGPRDSDKAAESIRIATGCRGAAIVDANDLQRAAVLGVSAGLDAKGLETILRDNPFGNDSQKTPIVIIKDYAA